MELTAPTLVTIALLAVGIIFASPVLFHGFRRRGKGIKYENNFVIQRAPQLASVINIGLIVVSFVALNQLFFSYSWCLPILTQAQLLPHTAQTILSWLGVAILVSGLVFMIGGWYSLGECFSTDAEVLDGHTVRKAGLLKYVMHPAYSGIIQSLLGASLASLSFLCVAFTLLLVAPLWLNRAKYEEQLLIETLGESYTAYAKELKWRRLIPSFFPIGV